MPPQPPAEAASEPLGAVQWLAIACTVVSLWLVLAAPKPADGRPGRG